MFVPIRHNGVFSLIITLEASIPAVGLYLLNKLMLKDSLVPYLFFLGKFTDKVRESQLQQSLPSYDSACHRLNFRHSFGREIGLLPFVNNSSGVQVETTDSRIEEMPNFFLLNIFQNVGCRKHVRSFETQSSAVP